MLWIGEYERQERGQARRWPVAQGLARQQLVDQQRAVGLLGRRYGRLPDGGDSRPGSGIAFEASIFVAVLGAPNYTYACATRAQINRQLLD